MCPRRAAAVILALCPLLPGGCSSSPSNKEPYHAGGKINLADFVKHTAAYKGKAITLRLKVEEGAVRSQGGSLRDYAGRNVAFTTPGSRGERVKLVIAIPKDLSVPEIAAGGELFVTFVCTRGSLRQGNQARSIKTPGP